ncbi:MAG TPA: hypothetical protein VI260_13745 [Blastocatellia bacterium]|jgi:hypothetical protein
MTRRELLTYYDELNADNYKDYVNKYLVGHWKEESERGNWRDLVTDAFAARHGVEGTVTAGKARDVAHQRSAGGQNDFTSTSLSEEDLVKIVRDISKNVILAHGKHFNEIPGNIINYELSVTVRPVTVQVFADKGFKQNQGQVNVVVGINKQGLICHYHGDAEYSGGTVYYVEGNNIKNRDK